MRLCTSLQYLREMPIEDLLEVADEIIQAQGGGT
nr:MAG TPA: FlaG protein [Caudoviricetes sp.]